MDNLQALAIVLKLDKVLLKMSKLSRDLRDMCNLNSAINFLLYQPAMQTVTNSKIIAKTRKCIVNQ